MDHWWSDAPWNVSFNWLHLQDATSGCVSHRQNKMVRFWYGTVLFSLEFWMQHSTVSSSFNLQIVKDKVANHPLAGTGN